MEALIEEEEEDEKHCMGISHEICTEDSHLACPHGFASLGRGGMVAWCHHLTFSRRVRIWTPAKISLAPIRA